jgi:hypothetical protein
MFFYDKMNLEHCMKYIFELFFQMLTEEEEQYAYFQQDSAAAYMSQHFVEALCEICGERIVSHGLQLPHLLGLSAYKIFTCKET